jgi:hypothetical protein
VIEMPTTYQKADDDVTKLVADILKTNHPDLAETGVLFGVLMAENPEGDAVKHGGYPALACVKVVSAKDRVSKEYDVEMLIDLRAWEEMTDRHKAAVIDHEIEHCKRVPNTAKRVAAGELAWKTDDRGRPKVRLKKGDWQVGDGFACVVARHGDYAAEYLNIQRAKAFADAAREKGGKGVADAA